MDVGTRVFKEVKQFNKKINGKEIILGKIKKKENEIHKRDYK
ncbi:hypothetical protein bpmyx0001_28320 [Bacillus pseudomycoides DSM 12442]|nr:hypothetical protein bpmyx0001_28320 [Bacillus pseudomycoides DSM 12442]